MSIEKQALEMTEVSLHYPGGKGVHGINISIAKGEVYGFLGPNGAGKTTVMKLATGLAKTAKGKIQIFGFDLEQEQEKALALVGCQIGQLAIYDYLTPRQSLKLVNRYYADIKPKRIYEVLEQVGLLQAADTVGSRFSTGMRQRLGLAHALLGNPQLLILDEPTSGLDIEGAAEFRSLLRQLVKDTDLTLFISSHHAYELEQLCDRIGIINILHWRAFT